MRVCFIWQYIIVCFAAPFSPITTKISAVQIVKINKTDVKIIVLNNQNLINAPKEGFKYLSRKGFGVASYSLVNGEMSSDQLLDRNKHHSILYLRHVRVAN
jgi:hypothetical protein